MNLQTLLELKGKLQTFLIRRLQFQTEASFSFKKFHWFQFITETLDDDSLQLS